MNLVKKIADELAQAKNLQRGQFVSTLHYQILRNAKELEGLDVKSLCDDLKLQQSYGTEIRKMFRLNRMLQKNKVALRPA